MAQVDERLEAELAEHLAALAAVVASAEALPTASWNTPRPDDKWSPAQVVEHLRLTYETVLGELDGRGGFRVRTSWWQRRLIRLLVLPRILRHGRFPQGVPATREIRPGPGPYDRAELLVALEATARRLVDRLRQAPPGALTHPYMGPLGLLDMVRFATQHLRHHQRQIDAAS